MKNLLLLFIVSLIFTFTFNAQQQLNVLGIYTFNSNKLVANKNSISDINKRLNFPSFDLVAYHLPDVDFISFGTPTTLTSRSVFEFKAMKKKPLIYKLDDLTRYQNNKHSREINYKNDPSQWNLHCIENRIQPYFLQKDAK